MIDVPESALSLHFSGHQAPTRALHPTVRSQTRRSITAHQLRQRQRVGEEAIPILLR